MFLAQLLKKVIRFLHKTSQSLFISDLQNKQQINIAEIIRHNGSIHLHI